MKKGAPLIAGLDIGSTKTVCVVGEVTDKGVRILGKGEVKTQGFKEGGVVDHTKAVKTVRDVVRAARVYANREIDRVFFTVDGLHLRNISYSSKLNITRRSITREDIKKSVENARQKVWESKKLSSEEMIVHLIPYKFIVNEKDEVENPEGIEATSLTVEINIFVGDRYKIKNVQKVLNDAEIEYVDMVTSHYAGGIGIINPDFKENVVGVIDLGATMLKVSLFRNTKLEYISTLKIGVDYITKDIATVMRITHAEAERIKLKYGYAIPEKIDDPGTKVEAKGLNGQIKALPIRMLSEIIFYRQAEIFQMALQELARAPSFEQLSHVYLIGGGARLKYVRELAEEIMGVDVSVARPGGVQFIDNGVVGPEYAASIGLLRIFSPRVHEINREGFWFRFINAIKRMFS